MRKINLRNKRVIDTLNEFTEFCFSRDRSMMQDEKNILSFKEPYEHTVTHEFLKEEMSKGLEGHSGFPPSMKGVELQEFWASQFYDAEWNEAVNKILHDLTMILTAKRNALAAYYPKGGYIGWHTNWNAPGYNVLLTYSETGEGYFEYWDMEKKKVVRIPDEKGWQCKVGYYGKDVPEEADLAMWHAAYTDCERLTFAYVIPDEFMWEGMIEDLEDPDA